MEARTYALPFIALLVVGTVAAQVPTYPVLNITKGQPLPTLNQLQPDASGWITLNMEPATIQVRTCSCVLLINCTGFPVYTDGFLQGPGDNSSAEDPYIMYTGRTYNAELIAGVIRVEQGMKLQLESCVRWDYVLSNRHPGSQLSRPRLMS